MAYNRKTLATLRQVVAADIDRHSDGNANVRGSLEYALSHALSGLAHGLHGHIQWVHDQRFTDSADDESVLREAAEYGITRIGAVQAKGTTIKLPGEDGADLLAGTRFSLGDEFYTVDSTTTAVAGEATFSVTAERPGATGNQPTGAILQIVTPVTGLDTEAMVDGEGIVGGADIEDIERVRERLSDRKKSPPQGGTDSDYIAWAKAAHSDVTRVWVSPHRNAANATEYGSVLLYPVTDLLASVIPSQAILDEIYNYIDRSDIRPIGAKTIYVEALTAKPLDIAFTSLDPNTAAVKSAIEAEIKDLLAREAVPGGTVLLSHIREAISRAANENDYAIDLTADVTTVAGEILVPGAITWPGQ